MFPELITELLQEGYKVNFSAPGHSMFPTIMANETIMVEPVDPGTVRLRDIILYRTNGRLIAHRVISIEKERNETIQASKFFKNTQLNPIIKGASPLQKSGAPQIFPVECEADSCGVRCCGPPKTARSSTPEALQFVLRGDASLSCDDPVKAGQILGKVVSIERNGCSIDPYCFRHKLSCLVLTGLNRIKRFFRMICSIFFSHGR
jgi:hypothetical protein